MGGLSKTVVSIFWGLSLLGVPGAVYAASDETQFQTKPNIVFILADDLGYADTGVTGARTIATPSIDSIATEGVVMQNGYASSAICSPTRTALLTGRYAQRYAIGLEEPLISSRAQSLQVGIPLNQPTIASLLTEAGYETSLVGKWHLGLPPAHSPLRHGYDYCFGFIQGAADYFLHRMVNEGEGVGGGLFAADTPITRPGYLTDVLGDEAVRLIHAAGEKPFFLSLHFNAPHWPWEGRDDIAVAKSLARTQHYGGGSLETYQEMVEVMDDNIGKVLRALEQKGVAENTIVVFTSDNGGERFSDNWPHVGFKAEVLEGGIKVPLFVRWPARIAPGSGSDQLMLSMDFLPTLLAATGDERVHDPIDGINLLPQILGAPNFARTVYWRFKAGDQGAVRQGDWKYVKIGGKERLFDVAKDPRERAQLEAKYPQKFQELRNAYQRWDQEMLEYPDDSFSEPLGRTYIDRY